MLFRSNNGYDGLYPFVMPSPGPPLYGQAGPWEWWDSTTVYFICQNYLGFSQGKVDTILGNALLSNPDMSKAKGMAYIDTVIGYLCPRLYQAISTGTHEISALEKDIKIFPNPFQNQLNIEVKSDNMPIRSVEFFDISGRLIYQNTDINKSQLQVNADLFKPGVYFLKTYFDKGIVNSKIIKQ